MSAGQFLPPAPFVPADVDLNGMPYMPLDVVRLLNSDLFALSTGEEFKTALTLWCKSWLQVPAASLPSNDRILAHLSGAGSRWGKVKEMALQGWVLCADNRLYHPVIAEKAMNAWAERVVYLERKNNEVERKRRHREEGKELRARLAVVGIVVPWNETVEVMRSLLLEHGQADDRSVAGDAPVRVTGASPATDQSPPIKGKVKGKGKLLNQEHVLQRSAPDDGAPVVEQDAAGVQAHGTDQPAFPLRVVNLATKPDPSEGFDQFYRLYPRRQKRADAEKAWCRLAPNAALRDAMLSALAQHCVQDSWAKDGGQFVPLPASWLNSRRWEDELDVATMSTCPAQAIVDLYHQACPGFDGVTVLDDVLRGLLDERWHEHEAQQNLDFWQDFLDAASRLTSVFYRGQNRKPYLEALVFRQNFRDIVEGRTHA